jgi:hypothetical protein
LLARMFPNGREPMLFETYSHDIAIAALYPPTRSSAGSQHDNRTSKAVRAQLGHAEFDWHDLFPWMPTESNQDAKQTMMYKHYKPFVADWIDRIVASGSRIVYVAGVTCNAAWRFAEKEGMLKAFGKTTAVGSSNVSTYTGSSGAFHALLDVPHPRRI